MLVTSLMAVHSKSENNIILKCQKRKVSSTKKTFTRRIKRNADIYLKNLRSAYRCTGEKINTFCVYNSYYYYFYYKLKYKRKPRDRVT